MEATRAGADDALAECFFILDAALTENGEIEKANHSQKALEIYERLGDLAQQAITLNNMGVIAKERSAWIESRDLYDRARVLFEAIGDRSQESVAKFNIAEILSDQGHYAEAEGLLREAIRVWRSSSAEIDVAEGRRELGKAIGRSGDIERALGLLSGARITQLSHNLPGEVLATDTRTAEVLVIAGRSTEALALANDAFARVDGTDGGSIVVPALHRVLGWVRLQRGEPIGSRESFTVALDLARSRGDEYQAALALAGLIAVSRQEHDYETDLQTELRAITARLGIESLPEIPSVETPLETVPPPDTDVRT